MLFADWPVAGLQATRSHTQDSAGLRADSGMCQGLRSALAAGTVASAVTTDGAATCDAAAWRAAAAFWLQGQPKSAVR